MAQRIAFFGTPDFSVPALTKLIEDPRFEVVVVITQPDRPVGRGQKIAHSPVKQLALTANIPVLQPENLKKHLASSLEQLKSYDPIDAAVVVAFGQILPEIILKWPKAGCINIHGSLLPRWRGAAPMQRAIMAGDTETGICLMQMDKGLDSGPVYCSAKITIGPDENFGTLHDRLAASGAKLLIENLERIISGQLQAQPQYTEGLTYAHKIEENDLLIDWKLPAEQLFNLIRGLSPFPGAYTLLDGQRLKIFKARLFVQADTSSQPGQIVRYDKNQILVQTGKGQLEIEELQLAGKKRLNVKDFVNGVHINCGRMLG